jgi:hypothetical protein
VSLRYRLEVLAWAFVLVLFGAAADHAAVARGDLVVASMAITGALGVIFCLLEVTLREAVADALCYALTGQRMPPRKPKA